MSVTLYRTPGTRPSPLDDFLGWLLSYPKFYTEGWGDLGLIGEVARRFADLTLAPKAIDIKWTALPQTEHGVTRTSGYFQTPVRALPLPAEARAAYFDLLLPEGASPTLRPPVCIHLAATAESSMLWRRKVARGLVRRGIGALILENPYYGRRRPRHQIGSAVRSVADQLMMNYATVQESRSLLTWLREYGYEHLGITGYSMGGFMTAYVGATYPGPVALIPCATGVSASSVYTQSALRSFPDWRALGGPDRARAHRELAMLYERFAVDLLPRPYDPDLAILVANRNDSIVAPREARALARYWGCELRWIPGGHFSSYVLRTRAMQEAVLDAFGTVMVR
ncbi:MAG: alpha/beta hydrolase family protein [Myxococcota bacterium]